MSIDHTRSLAHSVLMACSPTDAFDPYTPLISEIKTSMPRTGAMAAVHASNIPKKRIHIFVCDLVYKLLPRDPAALGDTVSLYAQTDNRSDQCRKTHDVPLKQQSDPDQKKKSHSHHAAKSILRIRLTRRVLWGVYVLFCWHVVGPCVLHTYLVS